MQARYARWLWTGVFVVTFFACGQWRNTEAGGPPCWPGNDSDLSFDGCPCTDNDECQGVCIVALARICAGGTDRLPCGPGNSVNFSVDGCPCTANDECEGVCPVTSPRYCNGAFNGTAICAPGNVFDISPDGCPCTSNDECQGVCVNGVCKSCGDGIRTGVEACDDGNSTAGDGCSATCTVEAGFSCVGTAPSVCTPICGDGLVIAAEQCDPGPDVSGDCCTATCTFESLGTACGDPTSNVCNGPDQCTVGVCQPRERPAGFVCRAATGPCDVAENCPGGGVDCPPDGVAGAGTTCGSPSAVECDAADTCDGVTKGCADALDPAGTVCRPTAAKCDSAEECTGSSPDCPPDTTLIGCCVNDDECPPDPSKCYDSFCNHGDPSDLFDNFCDTAFVPECRVSISKKGSLLYYSKIELKWTVAGTPATATPIQDTFLTIINDYPDDVYVQWYFINGDAPLAAVFSGSPRVLVERSHKGCNWVDCTTHLTEDESTYMSALSGNPLGCQPFKILDAGALPGRPDPENPGQRILRGYAIAFAVDSAGNEMSWNHLSGSVDIVNYADRSAWEYNTYAFQCVADVPQGSSCESENRPRVAGTPVGILKLDGLEYEFAFARLLFDFYAVGSFAFSLAPSVTVQLDTDLTLYPVSVDLRTDDTDSDGPVLTRARFDIWNQNEDAQSGVNRCINCWDQTLLSNYADSNSFLIGNLQTNKGKARIEGIESDDCDKPGACCCTSFELNNKECDDSDCDLVDYERGTPDRDCSEDAALLGVSDKILFFSGANIPAGARTDAGMTLVGQGTKKAVIKRDLLEPPEPLTTGVPGVDGLDIADVDEASATPIRVPNRSQRRILPGKE